MGFSREGFTLVKKTIWRHEETEKLFLRKIQYKNQFSVILKDPFSPGGKKKKESYLKVFL